ncbi:uncharacterized protein (DUF1697 family) [Sphingomonas vulcanisoli]|uniref:Uncharacterized protein (DUF1697 family) n=1 Tax=Sphingomonas vulcanisoli TaxID=1658060 RepID=A0ABX0TRP4_9SPHN|nr:DUF1697 domain-containing protein [Sphingomonas vulcanisoli]NIJ08191.1 uncharacterized protein (DUF1697 family) [Sphingomonas vulcanisoli]
MTAYVALLRAVNVGGTGKLPMTELVAMCERAGFKGAQTYIASGNALFTTDRGEAEVRKALEDELKAYAGKPVGVLVRTAKELAETVARNPFADQPGNRVVALFTDENLPQDALEAATGQQDEVVALGKHELFIHFPTGQADSRLRLPAMKTGTARNMNTVMKLAEMAAKLG